MKRKGERRCLGCVHRNTTLIASTSKQAVVTAAAAAFMLGVVVTVDNVIVEKEGESMLVSIDCGA